MPKWHRFSFSSHIDFTKSLEISRQLDLAQILLVNAVMNKGLVIALPPLLIGFRRLLYLMNITVPSIIFTGTIIGIIVAISIFLIYKIVKQFNQNIKHLKSLRDIDRVMLSSLSHKGVMNATIDKLSATLGTDAAAILAIAKDKGHNRLNTIVSYNLSKRLQEYIQYSSNGFVSSVIDNQKPLIISKIGDDEDEHFLMTLKQEGFVSYMGSPIVTKGSLSIGALTIYSRSPRQYTRREIEFVNAVSDQIAMTLDRTRLLGRIQESSFESVRALVEAIEIRDPYTRGHSVQVADLSVRLAEAMGFSDKDLTLIEFAALLHDIGKIAIPEMILSKKTSLSADEWNIIKKHPYHSTRIIDPVHNLRPIHNWILHHHERWDGKGYPSCMKDKEIPIQSRILAVCDTYSAMIGDRPYRKGLSLRQVRSELKDVAGAQFDPKIVDIFLNLDLNDHNNNGFMKLGHQLRLPLNRRAISVPSLYCSDAICESLPQIR